MKRMKAYDRLEKDIENYGQTKAMDIVINSLIRLTKEYGGKKLEQVIGGIIKNDIFSYVFFPEYSPPYNRTSEVTWGLSLYIMSSCPTIDKIPSHANGIYVLVQPPSQIFSELYFISNWYKPEPIIKFDLTKNVLNTLVAELYPSVENGGITGVYENISELTVNQVHQIKKNTGFILKITDRPGMWKEPAGWQALSPSQASIIFSNPNKKNELSEAQRGYGFDIDDLWVVKHEADELLISINLQKDIIPATPTIISQKDNIDALPLSKKKRNRQRCPKLLAFVKSWVDRGYNYGDFKKEMIELYLTKNKPEDERTFNDHDEIKRVFLIHRGGQKYTVHYSLINPNGILRPKHKPPALSSFKRIFSDVKNNKSADQG